MFTRNKELFTESGPELTKPEVNRAARQARGAAREAQGSITLTAKKQYRRYRDDAGDRFLAWPDWHAYYLDGLNGAGGSGGSGISDSTYA